MPSLSLLAGADQMEPLTNTSENSKKRVSSGITFRSTEPQVLGTSPSTIRSSKMLKKKGIISLDVIDVDKDEGSANLMFIHENFDTNDKRKVIYHDSDHHLKESLASCSFIPEVEIRGSVNEVESNFTSASHNLINLDDYCSDLSNEDDEWIEPLLDDFMDVDEYSALQAHFDHMDIPPDIEAPIPWLPDGKNKSKSNIGTGPFFAEPQIQAGSVDHQGKPPAYFKLKATSVNNLNLQGQIDGVNHPPGVSEPLPWFPSLDVQTKKKPATSRYREKSVSSHEASHINSFLGVEAAKSRWFLDPFKRKKKLHGSNDISNNQLDAMKLHNGGEPSFGTSDSLKKQAGLHNVFHSKFPAYMDLFNQPLDVGPSMPHWPEYAKMKSKKPFFVSHTVPGFYDPSDSLYPTLGEVVDMPWVQGSIQNQANVPAGNSTSESIPRRDLDELLRNFEHFKQFDTVEDHSDHHYTSRGFSLKQLSKKWVKRIQEEWKMLEKDLPDTIFVRVYESRMDLLRAVIIGAEGTPYHDGLFFFDVFFPANYPDVPPHVYYHSGGLRLNPNLYNCGKVCLSLLNTWTGSANEKWIPGMSTMLQVLVSIQGLILNTKPYFNEPGFAYQSGSIAGENKSQRYNEETYILSIKTMVYNIRRPPKHFVDFVQGHFCKRAHDILVACKAYMDGAQVGSLVKGGVQDLDVGDKSCSMHFKQSLYQHLRMLVEALTHAGASDCEKFLPAPPVTNAKRCYGRASNVKIESLEGDSSEKLILEGDSGEKLILG